MVPLCGTGKDVSPGESCVLLKQATYREIEVVSAGFPIAVAYNHRSHQGLRHQADREILLISCVIEPPESAAKLVPAARHDLASQKGGQLEQTVQIAQRHRQVVVAPELFQSIRAQA